MAPSWSSIELKVLYAQSLKVNNYFQKPVVFVQVSLAVDEPGKKLEREQQQTQRTTTVREGEGHPEWNQDMRFELSDAMIADQDHLFVQFDLRHEGLVFGDKPIGEIRVPFSDLVGDSNGIVRFVSYEVRMPDGKPNGALNFSYKVDLKGGDLGTGTNSSPPLPAKITGYQVHEHDHYPPVVPYPTPEVQYPALESADYPARVSSATPEVQYTSPAGAPYPSRGQDGYYPQTETINGYHPPAPPGPEVHHHFHHHHHGHPPPPPHRMHPRVANRSYSGGPRGWGPESGPWASWNGR